MLGSHICAGLVTIHKFSPFTFIQDLSIINTFSLCKIVNSSDQKFYVRIKF